MKTQTSIKKSLSLILVILIWIFCLSIAKSQTFTPLAKTTGQKSLIFQYDVLSLYSYLGIGPAFDCYGPYPCTGALVPRAYLHIQEPSVDPNFPLLKIEETTYGNQISFLSHNSNISYGIYQSGLSLSNYFEGSIGTLGDLNFNPIYALEI